MFELDVEWDDIRNGLGGSKDASIISKALKRNGYYGISTECTITLSDGSIYYPEQLSSHWELFNGSLKAKPTVITYNILNET